MQQPVSAGGRPPLSKDTRLCISLAARPSNIGTRFHNHLYDVLGLDFIYKAFTTTDIAAAIGGVRALGIRGCSVSMPFKEDVIALVDEVEPSARAISSVNTIVNDVSVPGGRLTASNTDYLAVQRLIDEHGLDPAGTVLIRGSGGMASAVGAAFRDHGFRSGILVARNEDAGRALADRLGYDYASEVGLAHGVGDRQRHAPRDGRRARGHRAGVRGTRNQPTRAPSSTSWRCRRRPR